MYTRQSADISAPSSQLTLERIHDKEELREKRFELKWLKDGNHYTFLQKVDQGEYKNSKEIWIANAADPDDSRVLVTAGELVTADSETPLEVDGYAFSPDRTLLLIYTNSQRVWRRNSRGDYWVYSLQNKTLKKLGGANAAPSSLMFAKFSPDGKYVAYVRDSHIHVENLGDQAIRTLTTSDNSMIFNGRFDWVYEDCLLYTSPSPRD